jgi:hypothetical protein
MVTIIPSPRFEKMFKKIKHASVKEHIILEIKKLKENPTLGKPMRYDRLGTRDIYVSSFRISYILEGDVITLLELYHKDEQ